MQVGRRLQRLRERRGMSQRALGELMGYSESWVQKVEAGQRGVERVGVLVQLADALRLPRRAVMDELFGDLLGEAPATFHAEQASRLVPSPPAVQR